MSGAPLELIAGQTLRFGFTNHRGEAEVRTGTVAAVEWLPGTPHFGAGWFLRCFDHDKQAERSFFLLNIDPHSIVRIDA